MKVKEQDEVRVIQTLMVCRYALAAVCVCASIASIVFIDGAFSSVLCSILLLFSYFLATSVEIK